MSYLGQVDVGRVLCRVWRQLTSDPPAVGGFWQVDGCPPDSRQEKVDEKE